MLEKISPCPCHPDWNTSYTVVVFTVPTVILFMIRAFVDLDSQRVLKCGPGCTRPRSETISCCNFRCSRIQCYFPTKTLVKVGIPSFLWIVIVLLDGSYYTCSRVQNMTHEMCEIYFSSNTTHSSPDLDYYCFKSRIIGAIFLAVTVSLLVLLHFLCTWKCGYCTVEGYYEAIYEVMVEKMEMQELLNKVNEELENKAKEYAEDSAKNVIANLKLDEPNRNVQRPNVPADSMDVTISMTSLHQQPPISH
ncbi:calcium homeostasis modulator protein 6-like [Hypanus sabinus]|uniref:calcium homeostasis modulator protein 6-like n=1 Tax=Hypanus sabinus TaxID=79690 RepID=UPI0028C3FC5E|nr:calcium homeostasis modulator protein 6-like [Hypanus sabinus]